MAHRGLVTALLATAPGPRALAGCSGLAVLPRRPRPRRPASSSSTSSASSPSPTAVVQPERPTKDGCHLLTYDEAIAPVVAGTDVPCGQRHTAQTFKIGRLDLVSDGHLRAVDSPDVQAEVARTCTSLLGDHVGGSVEDRRLSMVQAVWFTPSVEDAAAGADWFRCDVVALASAGELLPLPPDSRGLVASSDRFAMCSTAEPGAASFERVPCGVGNHAWRAISTVDLPGSAYPTAARRGRGWSRPAARRRGRRRTTRSTSRGRRSGPRRSSGTRVSGTASAGCRTEAAPRSPEGAPTVRGGTIWCPASVRPRTTHHIASGGHELEWPGRRGFARVVPMATIERLGTRRLAGVPGDPPACARGCAHRLRDDARRRRAAAPRTPGEARLDQGDPILGGARRGAARRHGRRLAPARGSRPDDGLGDVDRPRGPRPGPRPRPAGLAGGARPARTGSPRSSCTSPTATTPPAGSTRAQGFVATGEWTPLREGSDLRIELLRLPPLVTTGRLRSRACGAGAGRAASPWRS